MTGAHDVPLLQHSVRLTRLVRCGDDGSGEVRLDRGSDGRHEVLVRHRGDRWYLHDIAGHRDSEQVRRGDRNAPHARIIGRWPLAAETRSEDVKKHARSILGGRRGADQRVQAENQDEAVSQIESRETYGAILLSENPGDAPQVLTAPAGSAVAAQLLTGVAPQLQAQLVQQAAATGKDASTMQVTVTPVVSLTDTDPTGAGIAAASFPIAIGGMIGGVVISLLVVGPVRRLAAVSGFAVAAGLVLAFIMQTWFQYLQGSF